ncbi:hypothetical protein BN85400440 [Alteracholeplasma palmae J233]|uniref:Uncharacterized protein n=1 Tax=Alteracholeplasma palmae (strain ATCC 49389 / J233) TaxID=1318466 RepID=U4KQV0_ALTPJ|nr:hypothetical protein [Alteracholeplasma palmae]CCV63621.1 hypothetical protein BN85400440 [Alteracholeplasma palmae J233]
MKKIILIFSKRTFLIMLGLVTAITVAFSTNQTQAITVFQTNASALGFSIADEYAPIYMSGFKEEEFERNLPGDKHYTLVHQVLMRNSVDPSLHAVAYRVLTSPKQLREWGFIGFGSYGNNYSNYDVHTTITFPNEKHLYSILDYTPRNQPSSSTVGISVGMSVSGPSVSASTSFNHRELNVYSDTSTSDKVYKTRYQYRSGIWDINSTKYLDGEINSYGMLIFRKPGVVWVNIKHMIQYEQQVGSNKRTSAGLVHFNSRY